MKNSQLLFKAYLKEQNKVVDVLDIGFTEYGLDDITYSDCGHSYCRTCDEIETNANNIVIMQYIGIKDSNGHKIFNHQLVEDKNGNVYKVWFRNGLFHIGNWNLHGFLNVFDEFYIVGNEFQDIDLLEERQR